jgi:hypothetical protein
MKIKQKTGLTLKGKYKFTLATLETKYQKWLNSRIENLRKQGKPFIHLVQKLNSICKVKVFEGCNIIPTVGMTLITNNLTDASPDNSPRINYCAVGSGTTAPGLADTKLETETYRNTVASETNSGAVAYATMFLSATEDNGTYREVGFFSNGTASADSGVLVSHKAINITKSAVQTLTIDWTLTLANA